MDDGIVLSVVLPVHNEAGSIAGLVRDIAEVCRRQLRVPAEIIVVDDFSDDGSGTLVEGVAAEALGKGSGGRFSAVDIRLIRLGARSGQSEALMKGFAEARGALIASMDADGQFDPYDIPRLFERTGNNDMVCGYRSGRADGAVRKLSSLIANGFRNLITRDTTTDAGCTFRIMKRECVELLRPVQGKLSGCEFFFHPLILRKAGRSVCEAPVSHLPRNAGTSNYRVVRGRFGKGMVACIRAATMF
jgi:dolichol-phosphate mannosyltransferase